MVRLYNLGLLSFSGAEHLLKDLWNLGCCMGLPDFNGDHDAEAVEMEKELCAAIYRDRQVLKEEEEEANDHSTAQYIRGVLHGDRDMEPPSKYKSQMIEWIARLKESYAGSTI